MSSTERLLDAAGHQRSPVTMPGYHQGRPPKNKGLRFPADPPPVEEIIAVMRATGNGADGARLRALIVVLWRAGLRISEALDLAETDLDRSRGAVLVRAGKGGRRREVGMDRWGVGSVDRLHSDSRGTTCRCAVLRAAWPDRSEALGGFGGAQAAAPNGGSGGRPSAICAASAQACARCRARTRGRAAGRYPATARALQFGGDQHLPPRDRQLGDHRHRPFPARAGHLSDIRPEPRTVGTARDLLRPPVGAGRPRALRSRLSRCVPQNGVFPARGEFRVSCDSARETSREVNAGTRTDLRRRVRVPAPEEKQGTWAYRDDDVRAGGGARRARLCLRIRAGMPSRGASRLRLSDKRSPTGEFWSSRDCRYFVNPEARSSTGDFCGERPLAASLQALMLQWRRGHTFRRGGRHRCVRAGAAWRRISCGRGPIRRRRRGCLFRHRRRHWRRAVRWRWQPGGSWPATQPRRWPARWSG